MPARRDRAEPPPHRIAARCCASRTSSSPSTRWTSWAGARSASREIRDEFEEFLPRLDIKDVKFIPMSALNGDNVVDASPHTPWYRADAARASGDRAHRQRLESQRISASRCSGSTAPTIPGTKLHDFRGFSGQIAGGIVRVGQKVLALPAGMKTR
jgi:sulfate adenylyltransferase subunit 1